MEVTIFIYNVFLIILYSVVLTLSGFYYLKTKNNCYFAISILFSLYLFDNVVIYMTEFIKTFSISYNKLFIAVPTYKTLIIISILAVYIALNTMFFNLKNSKIWYFALGLLTIFLFIIPVMQRTAFKSWLFFVPGDLFFVLFNSYLLIVSKNNKVIERKGIFIHVNKLLTYTLFMSCLVFVEDSFVIFNIDVYSDTILNITNRNFSEDILRISQSLILIPYLLNLFFAESRQKEAADTAVSDNDNDSALKDKTDENEHDYYIFHLFCSTYLFTVREQEVFKHLLEDKNNKLISESLYISIGTVKTHVHNIFIKTDVSNRRELLQLYNKWIENQVIY
ncbi:Spore germination protein gerE [Sebaldella termitidis]|uniref:Transcriptional regulator, LuxR family n=1 Tax=Sebaldella termitidis (strain ATCC 33386 / NCTC 11300) TaxID=526218 RepID=D1AQM2_SEBTE|nr:helix-turn-helix transcriptional regulator [Sebaldella termitidis]ACZ10282.1 transcriptional regulator, LuxR family [Sebaldella termitidis ATCC 33386]SUI25621.1 Spore germination protein gerE [Sebaldella termitidis]